jgi:hypothetical protein
VEEKTGAMEYRILIPQTIAAFVTSGDLRRLRIQLEPELLPNCEALVG